MLVRRGLCRADIEDIPKSSLLHVRYTYDPKGLDTLQTAVSKCHWLVSGQASADQDQGAEKDRSAAAVARSARALLFVFVRLWV